MMGRHRRSPVRHDQVWVPAFDATRSLNAGTTAFDSLVIGGNWEITATVRQMATLLTIRGWLAMSSDFTANTSSTLMAAIVRHHEGDTLPELDTQAFYQEDLLWSYGMLVSHPGAEGSFDPSTGRVDVNVKVQRRIGSQDKITLASISTGTAGAVGFALRSLVRR